MHLAEPRSAFDTGAIQAAIQAAGCPTHTNYYIGGVAHSGNHWRWDSDNAEFWYGLSSGHVVGGLYTQWHGGEPNGGEGREPYLQFYGGHGGNWNDCSGTGSDNYVCEM